MKEPKYEKELKEAKALEAAERAIMGVSMSPIRSPPIAPSTPPEPISVSDPAEPPRLDPLSILESSSGHMHSSPRGVTNGERLQANDGNGTLQNELQNESMIEENSEIYLDAQNDSSSDSSSSSSDTEAPEANVETSNRFSLLEDGHMDQVTSFRDFIPGSRSNSPNATHRNSPAGPSDQERQNNTEHPATSTLSPNQTPNADNDPNEHRPQIQNTGGPGRDQLEHTLMNEQTLQNEWRNQNSMNNRREWTFRGSVVCPNYIRQTCPYGSTGTEGGRCEYSHPTICDKYIRNGTGRNGCAWRQSCRYYHPARCWNWMERGRCNRIDCRYFHTRADARLSRPRNNHHQSEDTNLQSSSQQADWHENAGGGREYRDLSALNVQQHVQERMVQPQPTELHQPRITPQQLTSEVPPHHSMLQRTQTHTTPQYLPNVFPQLNSMPQHLPNGLPLQHLRTELHQPHSALQHLHTGFIQPQNLPQPTPHTVPQHQPMGFLHTHTTPQPQSNMFSRPHYASQHQQQPNSLPQAHNALQHHSTGLPYPQPDNESQHQPTVLPQLVYRHQHQSTGHPQLLSEPQQPQLSSVTHQQLSSVPPDAPNVPQHQTPTNDLANVGILIDRLINEARTRSDQLPSNDNEESNFLSLVHHRNCLIEGIKYWLSHTVNLP